MADIAMQRTKMYKAVKQLVKKYFDTIPPSEIRRALDAALEAEEDKFRRDEELYESRMLDDSNG